MPKAEERTPPRWPLRLVLSVLVVVEVLFLVLLLGESRWEDIPMIVDSVGLVALCAFPWHGISWSRWLLLAPLAWRLAQMGVDMASHFDSGDHRLRGALILIALCVASGSLVASPLGRSSVRAAN